MVIGNKYKAIAGGVAGVIAAGSNYWLNGGDATALLTSVEGLGQALVGCVIGVLTVYFSPKNQG